MSNSELQRMQALNELNFTRQYVIPLFEELGFKGVRYVGGSDEYGRDVLCFEKDKTDVQIDVGIQVKNDRISRNAAAREIINQIKTAFENPFLDDQDNTERNIKKFYVVTSKDITEYCKRVIKRGTSYPVFFLDGQKILDLRRSQMSTYLEYSRIETLMSGISITDLLNNDSWIETAEEMLILLYQKQKTSPLQCINVLPNMLIADAEIKSRVVNLDDVSRKSVLHWLSVNLVLKAYYFLGKIKKFTLLEKTSP